MVSATCGVPAGGQAERMTSVETPGGFVYTGFGESLAEERCGDGVGTTGKGTDVGLDPIYTEEDFKTTAEPQSVFFDATED